jgi:hypothetical protein
MIHLALVGTIDEKESETQCDSNRRQTGDNDNMARATPL